MKEKTMRPEEKTALIFATGFGTGYSPLAPGTAGSLLAVLLFAGLSRLNIFLYLITLTVTFFIGIWSSDIAGRYYNDADSPRIVIDEILGIFITYIPLYFFAANILNIVSGFVLFRLFDILKPFPANIANKIKRPLYVLLDDIIAAVYAAIALLLLNIFMFKE
ncbi:MAG: phosphatidylglycerophosphatase A [Deltaproteobacteria bacterium]|nr:phosphatidylglycerophosphatase A [Deltaproteobacteria bacterium]